MNLSVIIPSYNRAFLLSFCLHSLNHQSLRNFEVIVVDDGSTDGTHKLVEAFKTSYPLTYFKISHQGAGAARNEGVTKAQGKILVFIDADMEVHPKYLAQITAPIRSGLTKGTFTKDEFVQNTHNPWAMCWNFEYIKEKSTRRLPKSHPDQSPVFRAILKAEFDRVGGYDPVGYGEDWTLFKKLGYLATLAPEAIVYHRNPATAKAVFRQATWLATRAYKFGVWGRGVGLMRASLPISLVMAFYGAIRYQTAFFIIFKLVYDAGIFAGIIRFWITKQHAA